MPSSIQIVRKFFPDVERVKDATKALDIEVTKRDAESRAVKNHKECAMAVACKRALHLDGAIVAVRIVYLVKGDTATRYRVPESVSREIVAFDRGATFAPGEYTLLKPSRERGNGKRHTGDERAGNKTPRHYTGDIRLSLAKGAT